MHLENLNTSVSPSARFQSFILPSMTWLTKGTGVVTRFTMNGTHKGEFAGILPTNKKWVVWAISIDRIADGKFVEKCRDMIC